ncbi:site-specific DNA-methyltransferase [Sphingobium phenoxybenzoativorans]|uniref:Methyltransferase n=1 Tax=Sphingobium phenoxybenzoativorans TaxID=1592790 RepID=A0A975Q3I6_9SPHN|nr:site-specific DNA-methyltransferase [Sphingobium phenoxybenzoativorans]QUT07944.1 site-specific DNA-methyltransferase [Sphingobium phenoxybenzoativorans]
MTRVERIGAATLYLGNSSELLREVGNIDAVITDPPYEFPTSGGGIFRQNRTNMDRIAAAKLDKGFDTGVLTTAVAQGANSVAVFYHYDQVFQISRWFETSGLERHSGNFWRKTNPMPVANRHYQPELEYYWHGWRKPFGVGGDNLAQKKRVWEGKVGDSDFGHPTEKPLDLMKKIVINASDLGQTVLDPFMGSGTTAVAALAHGRAFVGIEIDPAFFDMACRRIESSVRQGNLFGEAA